MCFVATWRCLRPTHFSAHKHTDQNPFTISYMKYEWLLRRFRYDHAENMYNIIQIKKICSNWLIFISILFKTLKTANSIQNVKIGRNIVIKFTIGCSNVHLNYRVFYSETVSSTTDLRRDIFSEQIDALSSKFWRLFFFNQQ